MGISFEQSAIATTQAIDDSIGGGRTLLYELARKVIGDVYHLRESSGSPSGKFMITVRFVLDDEAGEKQAERMRE